MNSPPQKKNINGSVCVFKQPVPAAEILPPEDGLMNVKISGEQLFPFISPEKKQAFLNADIMITGEKFGYGSSREEIVRGIFNSGISAIVCEKLPPAFFRNAVNLGLPVFFAPGVTGTAEDGDQIEINQEQQQIIHAATGAIFTIQPLPDFVGKIIEMGGVEQYMKEVVSQQQ